MAEWVGRSSMTRQARENCGVVGIFSLDGQNVIPMIFDALRALQHRGQEAWGIAIPNKPPFKRTGLVSELKEPKTIMQEYSSPCAIGPRPVLEWRFVWNCNSPRFLSPML